MDMLTSSYFNVLLVCVPLGWAASFFGWGSVPIFFFNLTSLIPLALVLGQLTEDLALRYGEIVEAEQREEEQRRLCPFWTLARVRFLDRSLSSSSL